MKKKSKSSHYVGYFVKGMKKVNEGLILSSVQRGLILSPLIGTVEPAQEPMQDFRQFVPVPVVGLYDNQAKKKCRSDVILHAIRIY